jgi:hypothetical protein
MPRRKELSELERSNQLDSEYGEALVAWLQGRRSLLAECQTPDAKDRAKSAVEAIHRGERVRLMMLTALELAAAEYTAEAGMVWREFDSAILWFRSQIKALLSARHRRAAGARANRAQAAKAEKFEASVVACLDEVLAQSPDKRSAAKLAEAIRHAKRLPEGRLRTIRRVVSKELRIRAALSDYPIRPLLIPAWALSDDIALKVARRLQPRDNNEP